MVSSSTVASMDFVWATVAEEMGYFEDEGLKVNVIECTDGSKPKMLHPDRQTLENSLLLLAYLQLIVV